MAAVTGLGFGWSGVPEVKVVPPALPRSLLDRPAIDTALSEVHDRRLATVVAGAGFGKSTHLAAWCRHTTAAWYTLGPEDADPWVLARGLFHALRLRVSGLVPDVSLAGEAGRGPGADADVSNRAAAYAGFLASALDEHLAGDLVLVLDDVQEIDRGTPSARLIEFVCRQAPARLHVVLMSRTEPPFPIERLRGQGQLVELTSAHLRFTEAETETLLAAELGDRARSEAAELQRRTGGWPAAVRLAVEVLRGLPPDEWSSALSRAGRAEGRLFAYLAEEVMTRLDPELVRLVRTIAPLELATAELAETLGVTDAPTLFGRLERSGIFLVPRGTQGWYTLDPLVRSYALEHLRLDRDEHRNVLRTAATWFESTGEPAAALQCLLAADDEPGLAGLLERNGDRLVASGASAQVAEATARLSETWRTPAIDQLEGEVCHGLGQWDRALACLTRLVPVDGPIPASVAWRLGLIHHLRGDLDVALDIYERGAAEQEPSTDRALVMAWAAAASWLRGDAVRCRQLAEAAETEARRFEDHKSAAAAHTALAMVAAMEGDRRANDVHYIQALDHAERAGDALQIIRIRANRGSRCVEEGDYEAALAELDVALRLGDLTGFTTWRALALLNRGQALLRLGRLEEARRDLEAARNIYQSVASRNVSWVAPYLGDVHAARGETALARACYEEGLAIAEPAGDLQGLVPSLIGLARILLPDDPPAAHAFAQRAATYEASLFHQWAVLALGRVALVRGDREQAVEAAAQAATRARQRRDRAALAEVLELEADIAATDGAPDIARARLQEARDIHRALDDRLGQARVDLRLAELGEGEEADRLARAAETEARRLGARSLSQAAASRRQALERKAAPPVRVEALGGFRMFRGDAPLASTEFQSRKARDLLKILIARRGHPVHREELVGLLWPDDASGDRGGSRLSVALSTLRTVIDPDRAYDIDHFVAADREAVKVDFKNVAVDVERFLDRARRALAAWRAREPDAADRLAAAEAIYTGDFLADDPYDDWAVALREEARSAYLHVARVLAGVVAQAGDADSAARYLLRLLERDPYDEGAHLDLVRAMAAVGRHGEARRAYRAYCARMEDIDVEPAPLPTRV